MRGHVGKALSLRADSRADTLGGVGFPGLARRAFPFVLATTALVATPAFADVAPGAAALSRARTSWDRGEADQAEVAYKEAIEQGGLAPEEIREAYVRLASARAVLGKKDQSIAAVRAAAILDHDFTVPPEAGKKAGAHAAQAKKDVAKIGTLQLTSTTPDKVEAQKAFKVRVTLDPAHVPVVTRLRVTARDGAGGKDFVKTEPPKDVVEFEIPASIAVAGSQVSVRADALDRFNNRIGSAENRIQVRDAEGAPPPAVVAATTDAKAQDRPKRGFWSSPWPYIVGGVVLIGGGATIYFQTRPTDNVTIGAVGVRPR